MSTSSGAGFCDHLIAMADGAAVAEGTPGAVTAGLVRKVYGPACVVVTDPVPGPPVAVPALEP